MTVNSRKTLIPIMEVLWLLTLNINGFWLKSMKGYTKKTMGGKTVRKTITVKLKNSHVFVCKTIQVHTNSHYWD